MSKMNLRLWHAGRRVKSAVSPTMIVVVLAVFTSGCAGVPANIKRTTTFSDVEDCTRLKPRSSSNLWGGLFKKGGKARALNKAERRAEADGATHSLVIESRGSYFGGASASVVGYSCE